jgi:hypothetical protein
MNILKNPANETTVHACRIARLICNYLLKEISQSETAELHAWLSRSESNQQLFIELTDRVNVKKELTPIFN